MRDALVVSDLDGTLLGADGRLSARSTRVLARLIGEGVAFTVATARSPSRVRGVMAGVPLTLPLIVSNGAFVVPVAGGNPLRTALLGASLVRDVLASTEARRAAPIVYWMQGDRERVSWRATAPTPEVDAFLTDRAGDERLLPVRSWREVDAGRVHLVNVLGRGPAARSVRDDLIGTTAVLALHEPAAPHLRAAQPPGGDSYGLDVTGAGATKGLAARWLADHLGLERVVAYGDGPNDLPLFAEADESYAVSNGTGAARAAATAVLGAHDDDAVARHLAARLDSAG